jgi:FlaA1/EpsC-like NDP-sugar epimerase
MTIPEAASLVLQAVSIGKGGELFILDMGQPVKIKELAEKMIRLYGKGNEQIIYTGLRPGEKMYEELLLDKETDHATERENLYHRSGTGGVEYSRVLDGGVGRMH